MCFPLIEMKEIILILWLDKVQHRLARCELNSLPVLTSMSEHTGNLLLRTPKKTRKLKAFRNALSNCRFGQNVGKINKYVSGVNNFGCNHEGHNPQVRNTAVW